MSIDTEELRREALGQLGRIVADPRWPGRVLSLLDLLAAAEHRATRAEAQSEIRGRAVIIYRVRARVAEAERDYRKRENAELHDELVATQEYGAKLAHRKDEAGARIKAVEKVLERAGIAESYMDTDPVGYLRSIRRALDGDA